jgi:choline dehydrogenase-like flavoprotein
VASRPNLSVLTEAVVEEIIIERVGESWTANGARFSHGTKVYHTKASKEVILCAGSVQSPQLLELSGIGNPAVLHPAGIEVKFANPNVGENLQEHMSKSRFFSFKTRSSRSDGIGSNESNLLGAFSDRKISDRCYLRNLPRNTNT